MTPPGGRDPELCDACTKTHINDDAAEYYDYALATLIKFQLHDHICTKILKQDVRACDYSGSKEVGAFLKGILSLGATRDWRKVIKDATGESISPRALMAFYAPLLAGPREAQRRKGLHALMARPGETAGIAAGRVRRGVRRDAEALRRARRTACARARSTRSATWNGPPSR